MIRAFITGPARPAFTSALSLSMMEADVSFAAPMPAKAGVSNPGTVSATAGTSGKQSSRVGELTPSARRLPVGMYSIDGSLSNATNTWPPEEVGERRRRAAIGDVHHICARHHLAELGTYVGNRS